MSVLNLILQWLLQKRGRSLLTMLSVAASFVLFGLLQGMNQGVDAYINSVSATRLLVAYRASIVGFLPKAYAERIRGVRGVAAVADLSFFGGYFQDARNALPMFATDIRAFSEVYAELHIPETALRAMKDMRSGAIISRPLAARFGWKVGDTVPIGTSIWPNRDGKSTWPVTIAGIYELADKSDLPNMVLINYEYFDAGRTRLNGRTNNYVVRIDGKRPARAVASEIDRMFANSDGETRTQSERELAQAQMQQAADIKLLADATVGAVMFMLLFVTGNTMMQAFRERTTQLAVLITIGFPPYRVVAFLVGEPCCCAYSRPPSACSSHGSYSRSAGQRRSTRTARWDRSTCRTSLWHSA